MLYTRLLFDQLTSNSKHPLLASVGEVVVPGADEVVHSGLESHHHALERGRGVIQKLVHGVLVLDGLPWARVCLEALVVPGRGQHHGQVGRVAEVRDVGPQHLGLFKHGGLFPRQWIVAVWVSDLHNVVPVSSCMMNKKNSIVILTLKNLILC